MSLRVQTQTEAISRLEFGEEKVVANSGAVTESQLHALPYLPSRTCCWSLYTKWSRCCVRWERGWTVLTCWLRTYTPAWTCRISNQTRKRTLFKTVTSRYRFSIGWLTHCRYPSERIISPSRLQSTRNFNAPVQSLPPPQMTEYGGFAELLTVWPTIFRSVLCCSWLMVWVRLVRVVLLKRVSHL